MSKWFTCTVRRHGTLGTEYDFEDRLVSSCRWNGTDTRRRTYVGSRWLVVTFYLVPLVRPLTYQKTSNAKLITSAQCYMTTKWTMTPWRVFQTKNGVQTINDPSLRNRTIDGGPSFSPLCLNLGIKRVTLSTRHHKVFCLRYWSQRTSYIHSGRNRLDEDQFRFT